MEAMEVTLEFCGGAEQAHNKGEKYYTLKVDQGPGQEVTLRDIFIMIRHNQVFLAFYGFKSFFMQIFILFQMVDDVDNLIESEDSVKAGVLVLINDADWDLFDCANYVMGKRDRITFISTLHGGWIFQPNCLLYIIFHCHALIQNKSFPSTFGL